MGFDLDQIKPCAMCGKGIGHAGPVFYRARIEQLVIDDRAVARETGLQMMLGGNVAIARALSPETDFAKPFRTAEVLLCGTCGIEPMPLAVLLDTQEETDL